jgi:hypothetical protein
MAIYKLSNGTRAEVNSVTYFGDGYTLSIPFDPANTDYQAYLKWLDEGNTPEPADSVASTQEEDINAV